MCFPKSPTFFVFLDKKYYKLVLKTRITRCSNAPCMITLNLNLSKVSQNAKFYRGTSQMSRYLKFLLLAKFVERLLKNGLIS